MSIEANTYEELTIQNINAKTVAIAAKVGEYLQKTWGIQYISLCVDGNKFEFKNLDQISEGTKLYDMCQKLTAAKNITLCLRSCNGGGANWRLDSSFMKLLGDDTDIKQNVAYRSIDYYDTDPGVEMYCYDENGLRLMQYVNSAESVADIRHWYCYTPILHILDEEQKGNEELHERILVVLAQLCCLLGINKEDMENQIEDDWEDFGEIILNGSVNFATEDITAIVTLGNQFVELFKDAEDTDLEFEIYAVPDGENDYNFASVAIEFNGDTVVDSYCKF